jgi:hypothetical protein
MHQWFPLEEIVFLWMVYELYNSYWLLGYTMTWSSTSDYEDAMVISSILWYYDEIDYIGYPIHRVWFGDLKGWKGGGGSGIGGIKSSTQKHEFCIVRSLKLCTFLGCKWGVPLVIGGGGPDFGVLGILGMSLIGSCRLSSCSSYHYITVIIHIDYINVHVVQFPMLSFLSCSHSIVQP